MFRLIAVADSSI